MFKTCTKSFILSNRKSVELIKVKKFDFRRNSVAGFNNAMPFSTSFSNNSWTKISFLKKRVTKKPTKPKPVEAKVKQSVDVISEERKDGDLIGNQDECDSNERVGMTGEVETPNEISNRKLFMARRPRETTLKKLDSLGIGRVKNARIMLKGVRARTIFDQPNQFELPPLQFFAGAGTQESIPKPTLPEVAVVGRSNVGKSRLLNSLLGCGYSQLIGASATGAMVRHSDRPGVTKQLNFFTCGNLFHLVDMPGYGFAYAKEEVKAQWASIIHTYLKSRETLRILFLLIDARHGIKLADRRFMDMLNSENIKFQVVLTKCDLVVRSILARRYDIVEEELKEKYPTAQPEVFPISSTINTGLGLLRNHVIHSVGCQPAIDKYQEKMALKALSLNKKKKLKGPRLTPPGTPPMIKGSNTKVPQNSTPGNRSSIKGMNPGSLPSKAGKGLPKKAIEKQKFISITKLKENIYEN